MTESLFILTTLFVAYVVYVIVNEKKTIAAATKKPVTSPLKVEPQTETAIAEQKPVAQATKSMPTTKKAPSASKPKATEAKPSTVTKAVSATTKKPAAPTTKPKKAETKTVATPAEPQTIKGTGLKEPGGTEIAKSYSNYRFTKRWIKDALVAEGLIDKVYKNDELTPEIEAKIKVGIIKLEGMKKYQP